MAPPKRLERVAPASCTLLDLSTEVLVQILACLPVVDLFSVQRTCRTIRDIVAGTAYLQYVLRIQLNGVDDFLPPDFPYSERLDILRRHERSWSDLRFDLFAEVATGVPDPDCFTLRDGFLIYEELAGRVLQYGYVDLCSAAANKEEEVSWVHIIMGDIHLPLLSKAVFAVDHDLVVAMSKQEDEDNDDGAVRLQLTFFEFTTGAAPHPLSSTRTVSLPLITRFDFADVDTEVLGDHVLTSVRHQRGQASFYLVSWKTGTVTLLRELSDMWTPLWGGAPKLAVIDGNNLITLIKDSANCLEICQLETSSSVQPRLRTVCFLELPPLTSDASGVLSAAVKEWVPTSKQHGSSPSRGRRQVPFYSSTVGTIGLLFDYRTYTKGAGRPFRCTMIISVAGLLSAIRRSNGVRVVPWVDWGPSATRVFETTLLKPAGPFWIADLSPLVVRDYDLLRVRCTAQSSSSAAEEHDATSSSPSPSPFSRHPVYSSTKVFGEHWKAGYVETHLPYRDVANDLDFRQFQWIMADREWIVGITTLETGTSVTVYHVG